MDHQILYLDLLQHFASLFESNLKLPRMQFEEIRGRVGEIKHIGNDSLECLFFSDELTLEHKIILEKSLKEFPLSPQPLKLYFKRRADIPPREISTKVEMRPTNAYGLRIKPKPIPGIKHILLVASGKGGVGKSTVSCNLSVTLARMGLRVGLLDADIYGPSAPMMLGLKPPLYVNESGQLQPLERHGVKCVSFGLLKEAYEPVVWRGPLLDKAIDQFCFGVDWGNLDILVVDLPPGTGDVQLSFIEKVALSGTIIVSTPQDVALLDAYKALRMFQKLKVPLFGIVGNMSAHSCLNCGHSEDIFGKDALHEFVKFSKLDLLASLGLSFRVRLGADTGEPVSLTEASFGEAFENIARRLIGKLTNEA